MKKQSHVFCPAPDYLTYIPQVRVPQVHTWCMILCPEVHAVMHLDMYVLVFTPQSPKGLDISEQHGTIKEITDRPDHDDLHHNLDPNLP